MGTANSRNTKAYEASICNEDLIMIFYIAVICQKILCNVCSNNLKKHVNSKLCIICNFVYYAWSIKKYLPKTQIVPLTFHSRMYLSSAMTALEEDIQEFNLEKDIKTSLKTQEELDKLTVDETLSDVERSVFILSSGQEVQCISVVRNLPYLLKSWQNETVRRVVPKLKELLHTAGLDLQIVATEIFLTIAKDDLLPTPIYTQHFLRTIITNMNAKDPVASQAWLNCLISVIAHLPREIVRRDVLGLAVAKGQLSQPTASRLSCCSILGAVASKFDANVIKKDIIPTVKQLCQDVEHIVRTCMCAHLHSIAIALGSDEAKGSILEEVLELAADEEIQVREAALDCLLNMTHLFDDDTLKQNVVPLVCKYCDQAVQSEERSLLSVVKNFGRFCHTLSANFSPEEHLWMLSTYRHLCMLDRTPLDPSADGCSEVICTQANSLMTSSSDNVNTNSDSSDECRRQCAYNFPAVTIFCTVNMFQAELLSTLSLLCTDPDVTVRKYTAAGLHEVAQTLQANAHLVQPHLVHLLREKSSPTVLEACLKRLPDTLTAVIVRGNLVDTKVNGVSELIGALLLAISRLEQQWPSAWRPLETLVTHLRRLPDVFTSDQIYYKFVNVVFKLLTTNRYLPVREAAACSVCVFIRHNRKVEQRTEMCNRLIQDLCYSRNFRHRILFFTACRHMMVLFSRAYFKDHLFEHVLHLFDDPVPNVRLCLCRILPSLKSLLKLPRNRALHGSLEENVRRLWSREKDRDVSAAIQQTILELDRTAVAMESLTQHPLEVDILDQQKEEHERMLVEREEKTRDEDARSSRSHGSSHSSSSLGRTKANEKLKKRRSTISQNSLTSKVNGNKDKSKSSQHLAVPGSTAVQRDGVLNSQGAPLPSLYNMTGSSGNRNLASHFAHGLNNPTAQGPSTALGHKGYQLNARSASNTSPSSFAGSLNPHSVASHSTTNAQIFANRTTRKSDRRKVPAATHNAGSKAAHDINNPSSIEPRTRKGSTGSISSSGSGEKSSFSKPSERTTKSLRRKNSFNASPDLARSTKVKDKK